VKESITKEIEDAGKEEEHAVDDEKKGKKG
jgi:hypothetical protein